MLLKSVYSWLVSFWKILLLSLWLLLPSICFGTLIIYVRSFHSISYILIICHIFHFLVSCFTCYVISSDSSSSSKALSSFVSDVLFDMKTELFKKFLLVYFPFLTVTFGCFSDLLGHFWLPQLPHRYNFIFYFFKHFIHSYIMSFRYQFKHLKSCLNLPTDSYSWNVSLLSMGITLDSGFDSWLVLLGKEKEEWSLKILPTSCELSYALIVCCMQDIWLFY